jgi:acyl-coenzyme A thioesterase 1/2/4
MQALVAASKSVDCLKLLHSMHAYFLRIGDLNSKHVKSLDFDDNDMLWK